MSLSFLVVDADPVNASLLCRLLEQEGHPCRSFQSGRKALDTLLESPPEVMVIDLESTDPGGNELLQQARSVLPDLRCIMMSSQVNSEAVLQAMKRGAFDFLLKPVHTEQFQLVVDKIRRELKTSLKADLASRHDDEYDFSNIIGSSPAMVRTLEMTKKVASSSANTVFIKGETGTGKELFARAIHYNSDRRDEPFIEVNCSAIPTNLLESELFGHEKGSFTDAKERKIGLIERASGGTFFLDEIGDMDFNLQAKLLRVLEERRIRRVGGDRTIPVDIRFVAATHKDLEDMIAEKQFREDLFFRLNVITIELPALRERREDIVPLAQFFLDRFRREHKREVCRFSSQAIQALRNWDWPGNIRELRNAIERALLIEADDVIDAEHLHLWRRRGSTAIENAANANGNGNGNGGPRTRIGYDFEIPDDGFSIVEFEKVLLSRALHKARHNVSRAARLLGLSRETMRYRIKKHALEEYE